MNLKKEVTASDVHDFLTLVATEQKRKGGPAGTNFMKSIPHGAFIVSALQEFDGFQLMPIKSKPHINGLVLKSALLRDTEPYRDEIVSKVVDMRAKQVAESQKQAEEAKKPPRKYTGKPVKVESLYGHVESWGDLMRRVKNIETMLEAIMDTPYFNTWKKDRPNGEARQ